MTKWIVFLVIFNLSTFAIDVDSKILATVIGVSETKRTILINKGTEQGLRKDTHAKFSLPFGMVARGIVVKVSPSRSVWSLYRVFHKDKIEKDVAVLLKISKAVRLTEDESKDLGPLADKVGVKKEKINMGDRKFRRAQNRISKEMIKKSNGLSAYSKTDFSSLEERNKQVPRDSSIDWSGLDGKKDNDKFDRSLDYSKLY